MIGKSEGLNPRLVSSEVVTPISGAIISSAHVADTHVLSAVGRVKADGSNSETYGTISVASMIG